MQKDVEKENCEASRIKATGLNLYFVLVICTVVLVKQVKWLRIKATSLNMRGANIVVYIFMRDVENAV